MGNTRRQAAEAGDGYAFHKAASLHYRGDGVPKDLAKAFALVERLVGHDVREIGVGCEAPRVLVRSAPCELRSSRSS